MTQRATQIESSAPSSWVEAFPADPSKIELDQWLRIASILKAATVGRPDCDVVQTLKDVKDQLAVLWLLVDSGRTLRGAMVTRMVMFTTGYSVLVLQLVALDNHTVTPENMREVVVRLEEFARNGGMDAIRIVGRKGWGKIFPDFVEVERTFDKIIHEVH